jgi:hypothetical protein
MASKMASKAADEKFKDVIVKFDKRPTNHVVYGKVAMKVVISVAIVLLLMYIFKSGGVIWVEGGRSGLRIDQPSKQPLVKVFGIVTNKITTRDALVIPITKGRKACYESVKKPNGIKPRYLVYENSTNTVPLHMPMAILPETRYGVHTLFITLEPDQGFDEAFLKYWEE